MIRATSSATTRKRRRRKQVGPHDTALALASLAQLLSTSPPALADWRQLYPVWRPDMPSSRSVELSHQALKRGVLRQLPRESKCPVAATQKSPNVGALSEASSVSRRCCFDVSGILTLCAGFPPRFGRAAGLLDSPSPGCYL